MFLNESMLIKENLLQEGITILGCKNKYENKLKKDIERISINYNSPLKKINIYFMKNKESLDKTMSYKLDSFVTGYCNGNQVYILCEDYYNKNNMKKLYGNYYKLLLHECVHAVLNALNPKCSMDIMEGICVYESGQLNDFRNASSQTYIKNAIKIEEIIKEKGYNEVINILNGNSKFN